MKNKCLSVLALFTSFGTLLCCVLPAIVATIAGGAAVGAMISAFPWLIPLSQNKGWIFLIAGILILVDVILVFRPNPQTACDVNGEKGCEITSRFSKRMLILAIIIYGIGAFFSYALVPIMVVLGVGE